MAPATITATIRVNYWRPWRRPRVLWRHFRYLRGWGQRRPVWAAAVGAWILTSSTLSFEGARDE